MVAQSIGSWVKKHTKEETMALLGSGVTISFRQEAVTSRDEMFTLLLEGAYMYHQIQSGIWSEGHGIITWLRLGCGLFQDSKTSANMKTDTEGKRYYVTTLCCPVGVSEKLADRANRQFFSDVTIIEAVNGDGLVALAVQNSDVS